MVTMRFGGLAVKEELRVEPEEWTCRTTAVVRPVPLSWSGCACSKDLKV